MTQRRRRRRGRAAAASCSTSSEVGPGDTLFGLYQGTPLPGAGLGVRQQPARPDLDLPEADRRGLRERRRGPGLRRRDRDPRVRSLFRDERGRDRGDRGEVLARRVGGGRLRNLRKRFGQHFLAPAWADKVVAGDRAVARRSVPRDRTWPRRADAAARAAGRALTAIEIDRDLAAALQPQLPPHVDLVVADFLDVDLAPYLAAGPLRVAGNLPYNLSSPILFKLLAAAGPASFIDATVMLQLEVAERLVARVGTKRLRRADDLPALHADVRRVLTLPPGAFRPAPRSTPPSSRSPSSRRRCRPATKRRSRRWSGRCSRSGGRRC